MSWWDTLESSNGSGAGWYGEDTSIKDVFMSSQQDDEDEEEQTLMANAETLASYQLPPGVQMTPKIPPGHRGWPLKKWC